MEVNRLTGVIKYVVVCCDDDIPLAYLDDDRLIGGPVIVKPAMREQATPATDLETPNPPYKFASKPGTHVSADRYVSETLWRDGHISWTVRCSRGRCRLQAQMTESNCVEVADKLATADLDKWPWGSQHHRYVVPLGVVCRIVSQLIR
jgi:hypothetical protein